MAQSVTSGSVNWGAQIERLLNADQDTDSFDAINTAVTPTATGAAGILVESAVDVNLIDSLGAGESFCLKISRIGADPLDTMVDTAQLQLISIEGT
jgi:hypothetical protein